ncbi:MAG: acyl-ACP--UDP-N-acetylglucosamine O-acyltransferase [Muribaculaceae bacterium]|jgi:UDP-N-acetylglucosamine acyltransferase|nr:acyl-ACP--UDP-N-acetylglucosamine O-acyltransferase [Muribaculaceae bacterium]
MATNISPLAHVDPSAKIGDNVTIHPFAFIDADVEIGDGTEIMSYTSIIRGTRIGRDNKIYQGSIIGADPQDFRWTGCKTYCYVGDKNVIREHVIINRGITSEGGTRIGSESFIMAETHIGHDTVVADHCVLGNGVTIAGDASVGTCSILSSGVILHEKSTLGAWTLIKGGCRISGNVPPFVIMAHNPASYFGVNAVVLRKGGFTDEEVDDIAKAYRHIYQTGTSVFNALKRIEADLKPSRVREAIIDYIRGCNLKIVAIPRDLE